MATKVVWRDEFPRSRGSGITFRVVANEKFNYPESGNVDLYIERYLGIDAMQVARWEPWDSVPAGVATAILRHYVYPDTCWCSEHEQAQTIDGLSRSP
jgi:hypothetical protein